MNSMTVFSNTASSIYAKITKTAAFTALAAVSIVAATTAQARPHFIQDVQYIQGGAQLVITPPQLVLQAPLPPVYVATQPVYQQPVYPRPVYTRPVVVQPQPVYYTHTYIPGRIYYVNGYPFLNGHPYRGHWKKHHHVKHFKHGYGHH
jgi:hypothetical protein